jgi:hypothetical protein
MEEFLTYLNTIVPLDRKLRSEIRQRSVLFPPMKKNLRLSVGQQRKFIFFLKEGIMRNYCILDDQQVTTHLFSKTDFISSFNCLAPQLPDGYHEFVEACTDCQLIAIPRVHYNYLTITYPQLNVIHLNVVETYFDFYNKYILNLSDQSNFKRQKDFSEEFPFLYRYTDPAILESLLELPPGSIPRLS